METVEEENKINENDKIKEHPNIVVGIDFGTSGIGYAYSFYENQNKVFFSDFIGQMRDKKVPTEIIFDKNLKDVLAFGNECLGYIKSYDKNTYEYFKNIKMNLYKNIDTIKSTNGREEKIEKIITKILETTSNQAVSQIRLKHDSKITKKDIKWVVTIPAIWEEKSKEIMINASNEAGLINKNEDVSLFLALEPEAAGMYYFLNQALFKNININEPYIICDIGAGTVDICTHKRIINNSSLLISLNSQSNEQNIFDGELIEEYPPIGGDYGGNVINEEFIKRLIIEIFGEEKVNQMKNNPNNEKWVKFEKEIEELKRVFYDYGDKDFNLDCRLFKDKLIKKKLDDYISEYNSKDHKYKYELKRDKENKWELLFPKIIFADITKELSKNIFLKIEEIYNNVHATNIIMTGAGSNNTNIFHHLYEFAKEKNITFNIISTSEPEVAVLQGAILFGFNNNIIRKRKSKYTLGIQVHHNWKENIHKDKGIKVPSDYDGDQCSNLFRKFITRNEYIKFDQIISKEFIAIKRNPLIVFYKTLKKDCTYIDEKDENNKLIIEQFGYVEFDIGKDFDKNKRDVRIDMKMGGTYIYVSAVYLKTGKDLPTIQNFINSK